MELVFMCQIRWSHRSSTRCDEKNCCVCIIQIVQFYFLLQIKIWFQNRRTKWKRKFTNNLEMFGHHPYLAFGCIPSYPFHPPGFWQPSHLSIQPLAGVVRQPMMSQYIDTHFQQKCSTRVNHEIWAKETYRQVFNIRRTKSQNLNISRLALQLSSSNLLKPGVKLRMKM